MAPLSEIVVPHEGEPQLLRDGLTSFYRSQKGMYGTLHSETLPMAAPGDVAEFQTFYEAGALMCQKLLRVEGLDAAASYHLWMDETKLGSFTGKELAAGIDLATLEAHPQQSSMEQIDSLSRKRHQAMAKHRDMWVDVMMQRATFTQEQIAAKYNAWREKDEQLREEMRLLAAEAADESFCLAILEEGYSLEELQQEHLLALEQQKAQELARKAAIEQAMKEAEERKADLAIHRHISPAMEKIRRALIPLSR